MSGRPDAERGAATVWVLALSAVLALVGAAAVVVGAAMVARHRAAGAADLAALAAAGAAVVGDPDPCASAVEVAAANAATVTWCEAGVDAVVDVRVSVALDLGALGRYSAEGRARAGPAPVDGSAAARTVPGGAGVPDGRALPRPATALLGSGHLLRDVPGNVLGEFLVLERPLGGGELVEDDVEHPHGAGLVERIVAVAALG